MSLLFTQPLWLGLALLTLLVHVGFFVAVRRMMRRDAERLPERAERSPEPPRDADAP